MRILKTDTACGMGFGFIGMLQIAYIILKLCGFTRQSWFVVLSPIISTTIGLIISFLIFKGNRGTK